MNDKLNIGNTFVFFDTCAYRSLVNGKSPEEICDLAQKLRSCENKKQIVVYALTQTLWELLTHIPSQKEITSNLKGECNSAVLNSIEKKVTNNPVLDCKNALFMAGLHAKSHESDSINTIPLVQQDLVDSSNRTKLKNINTYNKYHLISNITLELVNSLSNNYDYFDSIDTVANNKLIFCAAELLLYKAEQNAKLQQEVNRDTSNLSKEKITEDDFVSAIKEDFKYLITDCFQQQYIEKEDIEALCPISFEFIEVFSKRLYQAIINPNTSVNWSEKNKMANGIVDAIVLASLSRVKEWQTFIIVTEDKEMLSYRNSLSLSNHTIFDIAEYKKHINF